MKRILFLFLSIVLVLSLFACSGNTTPTQSNQSSVDNSSAGDKPKDPVKIVFATNEQPILNQEFWRVPTEKFMELNKHVTIENISQPSSNITLWEYLKTLRATGQFPDIMVLNQVSEFAAAGSLLELSPDDVSFIAMPEAGAYEGKYYLYPYKKMMNGIFYNKNIFEEKDISEPKNYQEMVNLSEKLKSENITPIALSVKDGWNHGVFFDAILSSTLPTTWTQERNAGNTKFNSVEFKRGAEKFLEMYKYCNENAMSVSYTQMLEMFFTGKAAMIPIGSWVLGEEQRLQPDFEIGYFPFPGDDNADINMIYLGEGLAISATTKHPEVCKEFAKFFLTDEEWYGQFLKTEMLFSTTKASITYEMSETRKTMEERTNGLTEVISWSHEALPGISSYANTFLNNIIGGRDIIEELDIYDKEWQRSFDANK